MDSVIPPGTVQKFCRHKTRVLHLKLAQKGNFSLAPLLLIKGCRDDGKINYTADHNSSVFKYAGMLDNKNRKYNT